MTDKIEAAARGPATREEVAELERLLSREMSLPWEQACGRTCEAVVSVKAQCASEDLIRYGGHPVADTDCGGSEEDNEARAALIVAAVNLAPKLLAELAALKVKKELPDAEGWWWELDGPQGRGWVVRRVIVKEGVARAWTNSSAVKCKPGRWVRCLPPSEGLTEH